MKTGQENLFTVILATFTALALMLALSACGSEQQYDSDAGSTQDTYTDQEQEESTFFKEYFSDCIEWCTLDYEFVILCGTIDEEFFLQFDIFLDACVKDAWDYGCSNYNCERNIIFANQGMDHENFNEYCEGYSFEYFDSERKPSGLLLGKEFVARCR